MRRMLLAAVVALAAAAPAAASPVIDREAAPDAVVFQTDYRLVTAKKCDPRVLPSDVCIGFRHPPPTP